MATPFTINIFYPDGNPANIRVATKNAWTGKVFYIGRDYWEQAAEEHRAELRNPGIYILSGERDIYIGQAENLRARVGQHVADRKKTFFRRVICVTERASYNNAHFRWMEAHLIRHAKKIGACNLKNGVAPNKPKLDKSEEIAIERFLQETLPILSALEITAFTTQETGEVTTQPVTSTPAPTPTPTPTPAPELEQQPTRGRRRAKISRQDNDALREKVLAAFQNKANVNLSGRRDSRGNLHDESKTLRVCCRTLKYYADEKDWYFQFVDINGQINFLRRAKSGYMLFAIEGQSQAIIIPVNEFEKIRDNLNCNTTQYGNIRWYVQAVKTNENFHLKLKGGETLDLSPYLFDIT